MRNLLSEVTCVSLSKIECRLVNPFLLCFRRAGSRLGMPSATSREKVRAGLITLLMAGALHLTVPYAPALAASQTALNLQKMLEYNNAERSARGIRSLSRDSRLDAEAQRWAQRLASEGSMYHSPSTYALSVGFRSGAENLAYHDFSLSASQAHNMWMNSSSHRRNMLDPGFHAAGFGIACSTRSGRAYAIAVVEFGGDSPPSRSTPPASPHVAGGQSMTGVGCSGSEPEEASRLAPSSKSPITTSPPTGPAPATTPAKREPKQTASQPPGSTATKPRASATPAGEIATKPSNSPLTGTQQELAGEGAKITVTSPGAKPQAGTDPFSGDPQADQTELASARSRPTRSGSGRFVATALAAGLAYLFLIRVFGMKRPQRRRYSPRHYSR
jgi:uncharacterized protein YkwD